MLGAVTEVLTSPKQTRPAKRRKKDTSSTIDVQAEGPLIVAGNVLVNVFRGDRQTWPHRPTIPVVCIARFASYLLWCEKENCILTVCRPPVSLT